MSNQYDILGKAPGPEELKKLAPDNNHLSIKKLSAGYGKMEILHNFDLSVGKAQSLLLLLDRIVPHRVNCRLLLYPCHDLQD